MSLVSTIILEADHLEELYFVSGEQIIPLQLEKHKLKVRWSEERIVIQSRFNVIFKPKITIIAKINGARFEVDINLDKYRYKYNLRLVRNENEIEIYANYI